MKNFSYILLLLLFAAQFQGESVASELMLQCRERDFQLSGVERLPGNAPRVNEFSVSFMDAKHYWSILAYEFDQRQQPYLLKERKTSVPSSNTAQIIFENYKNRLEKNMFYTITPVEFFPVSISGIAGKGHIFDAAFGVSEEKLSDVTTNERFALWVINKGGKIFFGKLHIIIEGKTPSIKLTKERLAQFMRTCSFINV
ncbi:hypothetical protein SG34_003635 [Thalassomonas viridans]|uniref:Lipoprotein n=1 Tax=Thalassomonas viridans TaxID=137584 RepID=A0AAE9Z3S3_9GAMM|nr:hypothetical protein [Thalassomonas viridans]WDE06033.1 hypothetical protein SG34_003635 [Thalassomonas viridans]